MDILSLIEIKISNKSLKFFRNKFTYYQLFGTVDTKVNSTRILFIIKKILAKYISNIETFKGRILKVNLYFLDIRNF